MKNPVIERMQKYNLVPRKDLGQHFLTDMNVLRRLQGIIDPGPDDYIVEFGAGLGILTEDLLKAGARVTAIELDDTLAQVLQRELGAYSNFEVLHADLAKVDVVDLCRQAQMASVKLVGNLPYQLTSRVLFGLLSLENYLFEAVFMLQREVAERIVAPPGSKTYGILSVLLDVYTHVELEVMVKPGSFTPPPRVESAIVRIVPRAKCLLPWNESAALQRLVKSVFNERRKTLRNTLKKFYELDAAELTLIQTQSEIDLGRRPETLSSAEYVCLLHALMRVSKSASREIDAKRN